MNLQLVIIHNDMVVDSLDLEPGHYSIGRSKENNIVVQHFSLGIRHGEIFFAEEKWQYRPEGDQSTIDIDDHRAIALSEQIAIASDKYVESEVAGLRNFSVLQASRGELLKKRRMMTVGIVGLFILLPVLIYAIFTSIDSKNDPNILLATVRPQIVELEGVVNQKAISDYKNLAGMKDEDFRDNIGFCTGFLVDINVVLTASHCLLGSMIIDLNNEFVLRTWDNKHHKVKKILGFDIKRDFLFLETEGMESYGFLKFSDSYRVGQKVYTVGNVHGEGIAIRDGIMASETPDLNDPDVKFIRYSAGTSPGNSGGPLIDESGNIVALVFASTWTENYNLGTSADDLQKGFEKFVKNRKKKKITIAMKKLLNFNAPALLQALSLPYLAQFEEYPEVEEKFNNIEIEIQTPAEFDTIDEKVLSKMNYKVIEEYLAVQKFLKKNKEVTLDWRSFVSADTPVILPSQFDFSQNIFVKQNDRYYPKVSGFIDSPSKADMTKYKEILKKQDKFDFQAYGYNIYHSDKKFGLEPTDVFYKPKNPTGRRKRVSELSSGIPYAQLLIPTKPQGETPYDLSMDLFLDNVLGEQGVLANTASRYSRPRSARDFVIHALTPEVDEQLVADKNDRSWQRSSFQIMDTTNVYTYCHALPEGSVCLARIFNVLNDYLLKVIENNFRKFILSHLMINPFFWQKDKLLSFIASSKVKGLHSMQGVEFSKKADGMWVRLKEFPFRFQIPDYGKVESMRLQTGLLGDEKSSKWTGYGVEWIKRDAAGDKVCGIGIEPFGSNAIFILNYLRDRRKQEKLKKMKGEDPDPLPGIWYRLFRGVEKPFQIYGYCAPLVQDPRVESEYFVDFKKAELLKYEYEIL